MTHDELLALIDDSTNGLKHDDLFEKLLTNTKALRAVVELHKPEHSIAGYRCTHCTLEVTYPCPTIKAVERELK